MKKLSDPQRSGKKGRMPTSKMRGFSIIELMIVTSIILIMLGILFIGIQPALQVAHINNAYDTALTQLRIARERAIAERSRYVVSFGATVPPLAAAGVPAPDARSIQLWHFAFATPASPPPVLINSIELPPDVQFQAAAGLPAPGPDNWGAGGTAIDFDQGVGAGGLTYVMFMPDGSAQDELGNYNSGVLYMAQNGTLLTSKAITVFGTTGRVRGWHLNAGAWTEQ
jgi:prepilin-type N-terminal cleavage/methylation domain-containing protein